MSSKFKFHFPLEIKKSKDGEESKMRLGGIASTMDEDSDGEFLDPSGFELKEFLDYGLVNWHHQAKEKPSTIIGEPYIAEIRKDGLYIECDLYPDSETARDVYKLAEVMNKNSKTRKLGFSIEGSVVEKDKENPKIIKKAVITGVAITHMPKNPHTFAEIIKGKFVSENDEEENDVDKSISTESASALKRESVDGYVFKQMSQEETYDEIFKAHPDLEIKKAEQLFEIINKTKEAMGKGKIDEKSLSKAMSILGFGSDLDKNPFLEKGKGVKSEKSPEDIASEVQKEIFTDDDSEKEEKVEKGQQATQLEQKSEEIEKSKEEELNKGAVLLVKKIFEKGMQENFQRQNAIGVLLKASLDANEQMFEKISSLEKAQKQSRETIQGLTEQLEKSKEIFEEFLEEPVGRRSITKGYVEKESFNKAKDETVVGNVLSKSRDYHKVLNLIDNYCDSKNMRADLSKAVIDFESTKNLPQSVIQEIKSELGFTIVD